MPTSAPRPCSKPGCSAYAIAAGRCRAHPRPAEWTDDRRRGNRHERGYGRLWDKLRLAILRRDDYTCQSCLAAGRLTGLRIGDPKHPRAAQVDHVVSKARGGTEDESNLQAICRLCHEAKTAREALAARGGRVKSL